MSHGNCSLDLRFKNAWSSHVRLSQDCTDAMFMPNGGMLGFGLRHSYPLPIVWTESMGIPLESLRGWLKGSDAALFRACEELGVQPLLRLVGKTFENAIMLDRMIELGDYVEHEYAEGEVLARGGVRSTT